MPRPEARESLPQPGQSRARCPRDSDWCDGVICREVGFNPDCPNADPPSRVGLPRDLNRLWLGIVVTLAMLLVPATASGHSLRAAQQVAEGKWHAVPCGGQYAVTWGTPRASALGSAEWLNPVHQWDAPGLNYACRITMARDPSMTWPEFCTLVVHEVGHLLGQRHRTNPRSVMYDGILQPIKRCLHERRK